MEKQKRTRTCTFQSYRRRAGLLRLGGFEGLRGFGLGVQGFALGLLSAAYTIVVSMFFSIIPNITPMYYSSIHFLFSCPRVFHTLGSANCWQGSLSVEDVASSG